MPWYRFNSSVWIAACRADVLSDGRLEIVGVDMLHNPSADSPIALDQGHYGRFLRSAAPLVDNQVAALHLLALAGLSAYIGFVNFHHALEFAGKRVLFHGKADAVGKEPRRPVGVKAKVPLQLEGGHALLVGANRMEGLDPLAERNV